ncbi:VOC family protein [Polycladidibacter stylochi]|uniref:VOC family protein n=1 Tax=Polycladidibacter stylochi TaxID=1807766 RepID=UPI00082F9ABD|nr:VOC family protein [Pseudovibrio stylochi]
MIGYLLVGTNDLKASSHFYDQLFAPMFGKRAMEVERFVVWQFGSHDTLFGVTPPYDDKPASVGNGTMISLRLESPEAVDNQHALALKLGATCCGAPGPRNEVFYGGYFRDLDGNKLVFYHVNAKGREMGVKL